MIRMLVFLVYSGLTPMVLLILTLGKFSFPLRNSFVMQLSPLKECILGLSKFHCKKVPKLSGTWFWNGKKASFRRINLVCEHSSECIR